MPDSVFGGMWNRQFFKLAAKPSALVPLGGILGHGGRDQVIPPAQGLLVFEAMRQPVKVWREVPGGYHGNVLATGGDALYQEMIEFWATTLP